IGELELEIGSVNRGFRDLVDALVPIGGRAACNIDVACSQGDPYRDQIRSVGLMQFGGTGGCSGVLLNNTAEDGKPYFLTALHCGFLGRPDANARSVVVYWNYQKPACGSGSGSRSHTQSGAHYRAGHGASDIALIELDDALDPAHELFLAGWDRSGSVVGFPTAVHHAAADVKSITPFSAPAFPGSDAFFGTVWTRGGGMIQGGTSGSPMFDDIGRVAGVSSSIGFGSGCHGGWYYAGRFGSAWESLGSWLDPGSTGATSLDGIEADTGPLSLRALDDKAVKAPGDGEPAEALAVDVAPFFWSRGGSLAYTASSSDESAATVSVSGSVVTLTPVAAASSTITVTAADAVDSSRSVTGTFLVTVGSNRSPEPSGTLADRSLNEGGTTQVASAFTDGDGDTLTYAASSTDTSVATVALSGSSVTVTAVKGPGTATIDVTATDAGGSGTRARHRFDVTVLNQPPQAVGSLAALALRVGEGNGVVELAGAFTEPEGEPLTYRAWSSASSVARATLSGSKLTLHPESRGDATFTVWARERGGSYASATQTIGVRVKPGRGVILSTGTGALDVVEGSTATYTVELKSEPEGEVTITPSVSSGAAKVTVSPSSLTFDATDWETAKTVTVAGVEDTDSERESATIDHAVSGADYDSITASSVSVRVLDDEGPPEMSLSVTSTVENAGPMTFHVTLSHAAGVDVLANYTTINNSAKAGADYTATSGTLTIPTGTTTAQVVVDITDDDEWGEGNEDLWLSLSKLRNATPRGGGASVAVPGTIVDDEGPLVRASWYRPSTYLALLDEHESGTHVWVQLDRHPERQVTIGLEATPGNGADESDYRVVPGLETFNFPGSGLDPLEASVRIDAVADDVHDDCESVVLKMVPESPGVIVDAGVRKVWILEGDDPDRDCRGGSAPPGGSGGPPGGGGPSPPPEPDPEPPPPPPSRPPTASFDVEGAACDGELCRAVAGEALRFTDTSAGTVRFRRWEFGDGTTSRSGAPVHSWSSPGFHEVTLEVSDGASPSTARRTFLVTAAEPAGTCTADAETLCLQDSRFEVTVEWRDGAGGSGTGRVVHAGTNASGMFSFFAR
ncbi:MAG: PKD domain-containing protein, partial [Acidobacteria bacterium]|nr:PKD domain-containing protein [Acidobacteriota bacterium]